MYIIALKMLFGDKTKYYALIVGIGFATQIITQQPAIFIGLLSRTYSFVQNVPEPDIWVMDPGVQFVEGSKPFREIELYKVRSITGVKWAVPMFKSLVRAKMSDGSSITIDLTGLDDQTMVGAPSRIMAGSLLNLRHPNAIFVDWNAASSRLQVVDINGQLRPIKVGDQLEINNRKAVVSGLVKVNRNFILEPQIFTSYSNAVNYFPSLTKHLSFILVKVQEGYNHQHIANKIHNLTNLTAKTAADFKAKNLNYWKDNTGIPINFGIIILLGFVVGAAITGQTFYSFIASNLRYYAVLKAMGTNNSTLISIVLCQAFTVGIIGYGLGLGATTLFGLCFQDSTLAFRMPPIVILFAAVGISIIIVCSALLGIKQVIKLDPASVFKT